VTEGTNEVGDDEGTKDSEGTAEFARIIPPLVGGGVHHCNRRRRCFVCAVAGAGIPEK
jgi:hypothetical protein